MGLVWLGVLAVGPGLCITHLVWGRDHAREPLGNVLAYLLLGALSVIPAALLETPLWLILGEMSPGLRVLLLPAFVLFGVALVEEGSKRLLLHARARNDRQLEEPFDWLVYAVAVALGFATLENLGYVLSNGAGVGVLRAFTAVPAHALDGTMMGWRLARATGLAGNAARRERRLALWEPTAWHAAYDLPLILGEHVGFGGTLLLVWGAVLFLQWRVCVKRVGVLMREQRRRPPPLLAFDELVNRVRHRAD